MFRKINIFQNEITKKDGREMKGDPTLYYTPTAKITSLYAKELYEAMSKNLENTIVFEVRNCIKIRNMRKDMKKYFVEYENEKYELYYIDYKRGSNEQTFIMKANKIA